MRNKFTTKLTGPNANMIIRYLNNPGQGYNYFQHHLIIDENMLVGDVLEIQLSDICASIPKLHMKVVQRNHTATGLEIVLTSYNPLFGDRVEDDSNAFENRIAYAMAKLPSRFKMKELPIYFQEFYLTQPLVREWFDR